MVKSFSAGEVLDARYRLERVVGRGGFGDVWRAAELLPDGSTLRPVALKLLHSRQSDATWQEEARIIAALDHPSLVAVYAAGLLTEACVPFVAMELLEGQSLADRVDPAAPILWRRALYWLRQAAGALDMIHRAGVVHLDIKPANLFLSATGAVRVLDFGISQALGAAPSQRTIALAPEVDDMNTAAFLVQDVADQKRDALATDAFVAHNVDPAPRGPNHTLRMVAGTPGFMAPEVISGGQAVPASDAYALAACFVQLATGHLPQRTSTGRPNPGDDSTRLHGWISEVRDATVRGQLNLERLAMLPNAVRSLFKRWLSLEPARRGCASGSLKDQLDAVWDCPYGHELPAFRSTGPFDERHAGRIGGRAPEIERLARELAEQPFLVAHGHRGSGLTSALLAGVIPKLAQRFGDDRDDWDVLRVELPVVEEGDEDGGGIALVDDAIAELTGTSDASPQSLADRLDGALVDWDAERRGRVLLVERLEHVLSWSEEQREILGERLVMLSQPRSGFRLLVSMDTLHIDAVLAGRLAERFRSALRYLSMASRQHARDIVMRPLGPSAHAVGTDSREEIVRDIEQELSEDGQRLPWIGAALADYMSQPEIGWDARGGVPGAACRAAQDLVADLDGAQRQALDAMLLRLVTTEGTRRVAALSELSSTSDRAFAVVFRRCVDARLIVDAPKAGLDTYVLSHPSLVLDWPRLSDLRLKHLQRLTHREELSEAAQRWHLSGNSREALWGARQLAAHRRWAAVLEDEITEEETAFLHASHRSLRLRWLLRVAVSAAVLVGLALWYGFEVRRERLAEEREASLLFSRREHALANLVGRARGAKDPYEKVALLSEAIRRGSSEPLLPLELMAGTRNLATATFLSHARLTAPVFPWDDRTLLAKRGAELVAFDFGSVRSKASAPVGEALRPHADGLLDFIPFKFGHGVVTRGLDGRLRVFVLEADGRWSFAAESPMKCNGGMSRILVADRAPVVACMAQTNPSDPVGRVVQWDLRSPKDPRFTDFSGRLLAMSADATWVVAARPNRVAIWEAQAGKTHFVSPKFSPKLAVISGANGAVALVSDRHAHILRLRSGLSPESVLDRELNPHHDAVDALFSPNGLDLAVCNYDQSGSWYYLKQGGRDPDDALPPKGDRPCLKIVNGLTPLKDRSDYDGIIDPLRHVGRRQLAGGWKLGAKRALSHDLVVYDSRRRLLSQLARQEPVAKERHPGTSVISVVRYDEEHVVWQVGGSVRYHHIGGREILRTKGTLLRNCSDGQLLAWRKTDLHAKVWELFDVRNETVLRRVERFAGFVIGTTAACKRVFFQAHDGTLRSVAVAGDYQAPVRTKPVVAPALKDAGYVFDTRVSGSSREAMWLALSGGGMFRLTSDGDVTGYGKASPRTTAMADGPEAGTLLFADQTGVTMRRPGSQDIRIIGPVADREWSDIAVIDGRRVVLADAHYLALVDLDERRVLGEVESKLRGRLSPWDDHGSLLSWTFDFMGEPAAEVLPFGRELASRIGVAASNLEARLPDSGVGQAELRLRVVNDRVIER